MYLEYFDRFKGMKPYLYINQHEWDYIKETFDKDDVKESLARVGTTIPYLTLKYLRTIFHNELRKLKGMSYNEVLTEGEWLAS